MMGRKSPPQVSLFYSGINLDKRLRSSHMLRKMTRVVNFEFVHKGAKENSSVAHFDLGT